MPRFAATCSAMNGSCATRSMPNARTRDATSCPMRPSPTIPSVLPRNSTPVSFFLSQTPRLHCRIGRRDRRGRAPASARSHSATLMLLAPGAFMTRMPRSVAASTSTLSTPVPARAITRRFGAASISARSTVVALRTISASASASPLRLLEQVVGRAHRRSTLTLSQHFDGGRRQRIGDDNFHVQ